MLYHHLLSFFVDKTVEEFRDCKTKWSKSEEFFILHRCKIYPTLHEPACCPPSQIPLDESGPQFFFSRQLWASWRPRRVKLVVRCRAAESETESESESESITFRRLRSPPGQVDTGQPPGSTVY